MTGMTRVALAVRMATDAHAGQMRKVLNEPYITHPTRVASALAVFAPDDPDLVAAGYLHDVVEDTAVTLDALAAAGFPDSVLTPVTLVSKWWGDHLDPAADYATYYGAIAADPRAALLKVVDRTDNLRDMTRMVLADPTNRKTMRWATNYHRKTVRDFVGSDLMAAVRSRWPAAAAAFTGALDGLVSVVN